MVRSINLDLLQELIASWKFVKHHPSGISSFTIYFFWLVQANKSEK